MGSSGKKTVLPSLFNSDTKIFLFSEKALKAFKARSDKCDISTVFLVRRAHDGGLEAVDSDDGRHAFNAPASGATVFVADGKNGRDLMEEASELWTKALLPQPPVVDAGQDGAMTLVCSHLMEALQDELKQTAGDAVRLDRQIAALREELENYRMRLVETGARERLAGALPVMSYERLPDNMIWDLGQRPRGAQLLPYAGYLIRAVSFQIENPETLSNGVLIARLVAKEDDSILQQWRIESTEDYPWVILSMKDAIPYRYRYVDLVIEWEGMPEDAPHIRLALAIGDKEAYLRTGDDQIRREMLAMRVWTGSAFDDEDYARFVIYPEVLEDIAGEHLAVNVPPHRLSKAHKLVKRTFQWEWLRAEANNLLVHPTREGPSIAMAEMRWTSPVRGISTLLTNPNKKAAEIAFSMIASHDKLTEGALEKIAEGDRSKDIIASFDWVILDPGTARLMELEFPEPQEDFKLYFMTSVPGGDESYAHAWFRNLKYLV